MRIHGREFKEGVWIALGQVSSVLGSLVLVKIITGYLDPTEYGKLALLLTLVGFANQVFFAGITQALARYYSISKDAGELGAALFSGGIIFLGLSAVLFLFVTALSASPFLSVYYFALDPIMIAFVFAVLVETNSILNFLQNAARRRKLYALSLILFPWLKLLFSIGLIIELGSVAFNVVGGYAIAAAVLVCFQLLVFFRLETFGPVKLSSLLGWGFELGRYALPFMAWGVFTWGQQSVDRWALEIFSSTAVVGYYAVLFQVGYAPMSLLATMIVTYIYPMIFNQGQAYVDNAYKTIIQTLLLNVSVILLCFIICAISHDSILSFLVGSQYVSVSALLPWMVLAGGLFGCGQIIKQQMMVYLKPSSLIYAKICTATMGIVLSVLGAYWAGIRGVVTAQIVFGTVYFVWIWVIIQKYKIRDQKIMQA